MKRFYFSLTGFLLVIINLAAISSSIETDLTGKIDYVVSQDGTGNYTTVQKAIDAVVDSNQDVTVIFIRNGFYYEKVQVPYKKMNIILIGQDVDSTIISFNDNPSTVEGENTFMTNTFRVDADSFTAVNITFENTAGDVGQALAFSSYGDKHMFYHCRFIGWQDTYFINYRCRNYLKDCYLEGAVDYIFGYGIGLFDSCQINTVRTGGVITAAASSKYNRFGLTLMNCRLTTPQNISSVSLGRPWQGRPHVVYINTWETGNIINEGWTSMGPGLKPLFAEYECYGPGYKPASRSTNVDYPGIQLTVEEAAKYDIDTIFSVKSFASTEEDSLEIDEMYTPFFNANLEDLILGVMKRGRDTFPDIPIDSWHPNPFDNEFVNIVKENFSPFVDSVNMIAPTIDSIYYSGKLFDAYTSETAKYVVELPDTTSNIPVVKVFAHNGKIEIDYPSNLPGYTMIYAYSNDNLTKKTYGIYNSVDSAFWDADLVFLGYNKTDTIDLLPGVYDYDVVLPAQVTSVSSIQLKCSVANSTYRTTKPSSIPGTAKVVVTAVGSTVQKTYTINFKTETDLEQLKGTILEPQFYNPVGDYGMLEIPGNLESEIELEIYNITGKQIKSVVISAGSSNYNVDFTGLSEGVYLYKITMDKEIFTGKILKTR